MISGKRGHGQCGHGQRGHLKRHDNADMGNAGIPFLLFTVKQSNGK